MNSETPFLGAKRLNNTPIFVVGCHRSGTTLLRYLLDAHPRLACPPETKFIGGIDAFLNYPQALTGLAQMGVDRADVLATFRSFISASHEAYARRQGKSRWVDKTPNYYRFLSLIDTLFQGDVLFVFLTRHPLDTVCSLELSEPFRRQTPEDPEIARAVSAYGRSRQSWGQYWKEVYERVVSFAQAAPARSLIVKYEELVLRPEATLATMLSFLGEQNPGNLAEVAFSSNHTAGDGDWKIRQTNRIHSDSLDLWRTWPEDEVSAVWAVVDETARKLNYAPPPQSREDATVAAPPTVLGDGGDGVDLFYPEPTFSFYLNRDISVVLTRDVEVLCELSPIEAQVLSSCQGLRDIGDHVHQSLRTGVRATPTQLADAVVSLLERGALKDGRQLLSREDTNGSSPQKISDVIIVTADRPSTVRRGLTSAIEHARRFGENVRFLVVDGSRRETEATEATVVDIRSRLGADVRYVGPRQAERFRLALADSGIPPEVVRFGLTLGEIGSNRNLGLLLSAGRQGLMIDDDVLCSPWGNGFSSRVTLVGHDDVQEWRFFGTRDEALGSTQALDASIYGAHSNVLGQTVRSIVTDGARTIDGREACGHMIRAFDEGDGGTVRVTLAGLAGDAARHCSHHVLFREGRLRRILLNDPNALRTALRTREVHRIVLDLTITHELYCMTYCMGFDNRQLLPPFMPVGRGEDAVFGGLLAFCNSDAVAAHLPVGILHDSHRPALYGDEAMPSARETRLAELVMHTIQSATGVYGGAPGQRSARLGDVMIDIGSLPQRDFLASITNAHLSLRSARLAAIDADLSAMPQADRTWASELETYRNTLHSSLRDPLFFVPTEVKIGGESRDESVKRTQAFLVGFGTLLKCWPSIWATAAGFDWERLTSTVLNDIGDM